ncbi:DEAD/DEAH box helicase [Rhodococcoides fascians]|uniref:DEAD/DEAH box helicase n=1 Tax=Rhodococcoides fascians TaxID=1828 RepID=UPI00050CA41C
MTHAVSNTPVSTTSDTASENSAVPTPVAAPAFTFAELGLPEAVVAALARNSITVPSPIQEKALPDAIAGKNVLGRAQTGSGKTLAFGLPILQRLSLHTDRPAAKRPRSLVLVPTRELAFQVVESLAPYANAQGLRVMPAVGGTPFNKQVEQLRRGVDVLVATPGRLADHLRQGTCILDSIEITALDEADQMADMGFLPEVRAVLADTPADGQRMLFSATLDREVQSLVRQFLPDHVEHSTQDGKASVRTMDHYVLMVDRGQKDLVLSEIGAREGGRTIMFARTKLGCDGITDRLRALGIAAESLHGGKAQNQRTRVLERFKNGRTPVLVATDVAARGIHVDGIDLVVHVDPPADHKDYLHRAGRTARAGEKGTVVAIVLPNQRRQVLRLTGMAGVKATAVNVSPGSAELNSITGAKKPTGEPLRAESSPRDRNSRPGYQGSNPRSGGGYQGSNPRSSGGYQGSNPRSSGGYQGSNPRSEGGYQGDRPRTGYQGSNPRSSGGYQGSNPRSEGGYQGDRPRRTDSSSYRGSESRGYEGRGSDNRGSDNRRPASAPRQDEHRSGGFRSRTERRSYDGFDGPARSH